MLGKVNAYYATLIVALLLCVSVHAQDTISKDYLHLELGGTAGLGSIQWERSFQARAGIEYSWVCGFSTFPIDANNGIVFLVPTLLRCSVGESEHRAELSIGQVLSLSTKGSMFSMFTPAVGYRYQQTKSRWVYAIRYTPIISYLLQFQYQHWVGLNVGYQL